MWKSNVPQIFSKNSLKNENTLIFKKPYRHIHKNHWYVVIDDI